MNRTQRLSRILRRYASVGIWACAILLVFSPAMVFLDSFTLDMANHLLRMLDVDAFRFNSGHVGWMLRTLVWALIATTFTAGVLSLGALIRLLHQFEEGTAFSQESVRLVRFLGWIQVATTPIGLLMFWGLAVVTKSLIGQTIHPWKQVGPSSLDGLFSGGITLLVAYVLEEGCRLKAEQDLVI
jgi:hypothetical protein